MLRQSNPDVFRIVFPIKIRIASQNSKIIKQTDIRRNNTQFCGDTHNGIADSSAFVSCIGKIFYVFQLAVNPVLKNSSLLFKRNKMMAPLVRNNRPGGRKGNVSVVFSIAFKNI